MSDWDNNLETLLKLIAWFAGTICCLISIGFFVVLLLDDLRKLGWIK